MNRYFSKEKLGELTFYKIPKMLFTDKKYNTLSVCAKVLYCMLLDRASLSKQSNIIAAILKGRKVRKDNAAEGQGRRKTQRIIIYYKFIGAIDIPAGSNCGRLRKETRQGVEVEYITQSKSA